MPTDGTLAEQVAIGVENVRPKPPHLTWQQAAALPLAGLTAYRATIVQGKLQAGQTVLITGIGGGVATFALQLAIRAGARVLVTSSSPEKIDRALELGATAGFDYTWRDWNEELLTEYGTVDLIIDSAAGAGYAGLIEVAAFGGRIVNCGATTGAPEHLDMFKVFWKQLTLQGTTLGSPDDFQALLAFVSKYEMAPIIDRTFPLAAANEALEHMRDSRQFGKIALQITDDA
jgi:NADPH:quinone reductase-like Zn-dependent oxidoreductase